MIRELRASRAKLFDAFKALGEKSDFDAVKDAPEFDRLKAELSAKDAEIERAKAIQEASAKTAQPVAGQEPSATVEPTVNSDPYTSLAAAEAKGLTTNKGLIFGGCAKMIGEGGGNIYNARLASREKYGENHPVTKALLAGVGASGGFMVPPAYVAEIIELLRPQAVVRSAGPRALPMPRGTMRLPSQTSAATASYGAEDKKITASRS